MTGTNSFLNHLSSLWPVTEELKAALPGIITRELYVKNQIILTSGEVENRVWYVERGFAMEYCNKNGEKTPYRFWQEGQIIGDVASFFRQTPTDVYIEVLENSVLLAINYEQIESLLPQFPEINILYQSLINNSYHYAIKKALELLTLTPEERYLQLMKTEPTLLQKISMEYIATYLGVSRKTLSRVRAKKWK